MDDKKREIRFRDTKDIKVRSGKDSVILLKTKSDERVTVGPSAGEEFGRSLIEEYKRWINENTDKEASVEFVSYDIPFLKWGKYVIEFHED